MGEKNTDKVYFNRTIAEDVGVEEAVMLNNIYFWIKVNEKNDANFRQGKYWMFNTVREFAEQYSYWTEGQVRRIISNLKRKEYIEVGAFNRKGYDKTKWYTISEKALSVLTTCVTSAKTVKTFEDNHQPIPDTIHK